MKIIVIGGGWGGCAAALQAAKMGARVVLVERTDMLLGTGLVGGIMRNNGRFTATEELIALGGGKLFQRIDANLLFRGIRFPGHDHAALYNVATMEPIIRETLLKHGVEIEAPVRITDVTLSGSQLVSVTGKQHRTTVAFEGDAFIDTTGTAASPGNCNKYGNGCAMCVLRCHTFGPRVSVAAKAGVKEFAAVNNGQTGAMSGSCKLHKESLDPEIIQMLDTTGVAVIPIPPALRLEGKLTIKACQQYAIPEFEENLILLNTGHAKLMTPFFPLEQLRKIPGLKHARYEDPYSGGRGNSVRFIGISPRDDALRVTPLGNLLCAGEKAGLLVGHTEAICTGTLAGYNAVRAATGKALLVLPESLVIGDAIAHVRRQAESDTGVAQKYTFSGSVLFDRMKAQGRYTTSIAEIQQRVDHTGLANVFA